MKCKKCGAEIKEDSKFCSECGAPIKEEKKEEEIKKEKDNKGESKAENKESFFSGKKNIVISILCVVIVALVIFFAVGNSSGKSSSNFSYDGTYYEDSDYMPIKVIIGDGEMTISGASDSITKEYKYDEKADTVSIDWKSDEDDETWEYKYVLSKSSDNEYTMNYLWGSDDTDEHYAKTYNLIKGDDESKKDKTNDDKSSSKTKTITGGSLSAGTYTVGTDLEAGTYDFTYTVAIPEEDYWGNDYIWITRNGSEGENSTLGGDKFDERYGDFEYSMASSGAKCHVTLNDGDTVRVDSNEGNWKY